MAPFSKPETVLKQAEGLVSVGQNHAALQSLTDIFGSKRLRSTPLAALEPIMLRFVELCVDMRKGRTAKEGLMQYKNIAQNTSIGSIELVIKRFVQLADQKVQEAQQQAEKVIVNLEDVDDLEATETPESILLGAVSGDQNKDRTDRALVTPWLKFLWESYRTALETLKNNARLEIIYQQIAQQAFKFCLKHTRKVEFRRLCETLRLHLSNVAKYAHQPHAVNLSDPDTLQRHLDTRFAQLSAAVELELWQEAFRSVEDVHNLLTMAKKTPRPSMMAGYYEKLTKIFLMSGNGLYHAAAWNRYYSIVRTNPSANTAKFSDDESMSKLAGVVLLSALAVPLRADILEQHSNRVSRLTTLLGLTKMHSRASLIASALSSCTLKDVPLLKTVPEPIKAMYNLLESSFDPLQLCASAKPILLELETIHEGIYAAYVPPLREVILSRLFSQLSGVYDSIQILKLLTLVKPLGNDEAEEITERAKLEAFILSAARRGEFSVRVDHATGVISFEEDAFEPPETPAITSSSTSAQPTESEVIRTRLSTIANALHASLEIIEPTPVPPVDIPALFAAAEAERKALKLRRAIVARRRELLSELSARKEKEDAGRRAEASRREKEEESRRQLEDIRRRELERARKERENIKNEETKKLAKTLQDRGKLPVAIEKIDELDSDSLMRLQVEQLEKEKREHSQRLRLATKRLDHLERALRKEERPLLAKDYEEQQAMDKEAHQRLVESQLQASKDAHAISLATKARLARMMEDYRQRRKDLAGKRGDEYARKKEEAAMKIEEEKAKRRKAIAKAKEEERKRKEEEERKKREAEEEAARIEEERIAEENRKQDEEKRKKEAEAEEIRRKEAAATAARAEREAERKKAEEAARRQQQREEEAELKAKQRREAEKATKTQAAPTRTDSSAWRRTGAPSTATPPPPTAPTSASSYRPPFASAGRGGAASGGGWRAREAAKQAGATTENSNSPVAPPPAARVESPKPDKPEDDDGFQTVSKKQPVWRPSRARG